MADDIWFCIIEYNKLCKIHVVHFMYSTIHEKNNFADYLIRFT